MTSTQDKVRSLFLATLMVLSVFGGSIAFAGTAAAANSPANLGFSAANGGTPLNLVSGQQTTSDITFDVDDLNDNNSGQTVNIVVSAEDGVEFSSLNSVNTGVSVSSSASVNSDGDIVFSVQPSSSNTNAQFTLDGVVVDAPTVGSDTNYNLSVSVNDTGGSDSANTFTDAFAVSANVSDQTGFLSGRVSDQNNNDVPNANVTAINTTNGLTFTTQTDQQGAYTLEVPEGTYNITVDRDGFTTAEAKDLTVESNKTTTANLVIRRLLVPTTLEATPDSTSAFVGDNVTFTVTLFDQDGNVLADEPVEASAPSSDVTFVSTTSNTTDSNGQATFTVTSDSIVNAEDVIFNATNNLTTSDVSTVSFIQSGEGAVDGKVYDSSTTNGLANATVYAVLENRYSDNTVNTSVNLTSLELTDNDNTIFVRLVDNDTGAIIDNDQYDIRTLNNTATGVRKVESLNETNASVGEGFALVDLDGDGVFNFSHTRLEAEDYVAQVSLDANNASDTRVADDDPENFAVEVGPFTPSANLTSEAAEAREDVTGANLVDMTNEYGDFKLTQLYTNYQAGVDYVVIAEKAGYSTDFADVFVQEDGATFDDRDLKGFNLDPEEIEPVAVNITQIGTHPPLSETGGMPDPAQITEFENKSDDFAQRVPRDGQTVDVLEVETLDADGNRLNGTVEVAVEDFDDFNGSFDNTTYGGTTVSVSPATDTITVSTGDDGVATLLLFADSNSTSLTTNKTAVLTNDRSATDNSTVEFVGTITVSEAEVSGIVTNENNAPVPANVWLTEIDLEGTTFDVEPIGFGVHNGESVIREFRITRTDTGESATFNASYGQQKGDYDFSDFEGVSLGPNVANLTIATLSTDADTQAGSQSSYTLPRVPTIDQNAVLTSDVAVSGASDITVAQAAAADDFSLLDIGTSVSTITEPQRTSTANVEITGASGGPFGVDDVAVSPSEVAAGEQVTVTANITNNGGVPSSTTVEVTLNGTTVATQSTDIIAAGGTDSVEVTFTTDSELANGTYDVELASPNADGSAELTIGNSSNGGEVTFGDVIDTISAFNNGDEDVTFNDVIDTIEAFNSGN